MNDIMREGLLAGKIDVRSQPDCIDVDAEWLRSLLGVEPKLGMTVAIGKIDPAVYQIRSGLTHGYGKSIDVFYLAAVKS